VGEKRVRFLLDGDNKAIIEEVIDVALLTAENVACLPGRIGKLERVASWQYDLEVFEDTFPRPFE
jgi:hypothetical protein